MDGCARARCPTDPSGRLEDSIISIYRIGSVNDATVITRKFVAAWRWPCRPRRSLSGPRGRSCWCFCERRRRKCLSRPTGR